MNLKHKKFDEKIERDFFIAEVKMEIHKTGPDSE